eukprot:CAMPEP_0204608056 /NCGR_PEP_ID=MMETSP0661-20131031/60081_1 /ASSEMBLY_ACC=CAM_ASM_000606 /TAXON_ID=109239 /ORGANISM="Alexandrium margalefi, Strain AMGDE01CS-322" /LENGTH=882 /DNA_ID=CAMNT_0051619527 /DNA_START=60 /DNA_END=2708 /DNA_ORIENTATION=+
MTRHCWIFAGLLAGRTAALHHHQAAVDQAENELGGSAWLDANSSKPAGRHTVALNRQAAVHGAESDLGSAWLDVDSGKPAGGTLVATIGLYPDATSTAPGGTIAVTKTATGISLVGVLTGLETSATGGIHIHSGFTCSVAADVGGHYFDGMNTDPWTTTYSSDANGAAYVDLSLADFSLWGDKPVGGRAVVVHNSAGARVGCGLLQFTTGQIAIMGTYPGFSGTEAVKGVIVTTQTRAGITLTGTLIGLPASSTGGYHIHSGYTCDGHLGVHGHYYLPLPTDPWIGTTYTSDAQGTVTLNQLMADFTLYANMPVMGRAVVVHSSLGARIGCGAIGQAETLVGTVGTYPGFSGAAPAGTVAVTESSSGIHVRGVVTGLTASTTGGIHIHSGFTCDVETLVGGHYQGNLAGDPWTTTYTSDADGVATISLTVAGLTLSGTNPVAGRTVVVHSVSGTRVGCGVLSVTSGQVTHLGVYPEYSGTEVVVGTIVTTKTSTGINMRGTAAGLPKSTTAGFHIHSGYSCAAAAGVGGHYFEGMSSDPWTTTYTSDAKGAVSIVQAMSDFSLYGSKPVMGRTMVFHSTSAKIGCGVIGHAETLVARLSAYPGYTGVAPEGTLAVTETASGIQIRGVMTGLPALIEAGIHIHSGFSCSAAADVGGHYYDGLPSDPWTTTYTSDANGSSRVAFTVDGFTISQTMPVAGRALVVHDKTGTRTGCALLQVSTGQVTHIGIYPGFGNSDGEPYGTVVTEDGPADNIVMTGTLGNLPHSVTAGFHIHSGFSCDAAAGVGGHYYDGLPSDPWTTTYTSNSFGAAQVSLDLTDFSLYSSYPVLGRSIVVHSRHTKIGCGGPGTAPEATAMAVERDIPMVWLLALMGIISTICIGRTFYS